MNIKDLPDHEKPREKLIEEGSAGLKDKNLAENKTFLLIISLQV